MPYNPLKNLLRQANATINYDYGYQVDCNLKIRMNLEIGGLRLEITQEHLVRKDNGICNLAVFEMQNNFPVKWIFGLF